MADDKEETTDQVIIDKAKTKWGKFKQFIWNSEKKEFMGRTALSWAKILVFYFVFFYPLLLAFWYSCMLVLMQTINDLKPKYMLDKSLIGTVPGLSYRPLPIILPNSMKSEVIWLHTNRSETTKHWVSSLNTFLEPYFKQDGAVNCSSDQPTGRNRVCLVPVKGTCDQKNNYGYDNGKPCFLLKLNKIYGWYPKTFNDFPKDLKDNLQDPFEKDLVYVTCVGDTEEDKNNTGNVHYYPKQGIPSYYYPFTNQKGYLSPLVFVQFGNLKRGLVVLIRCRAHFQDINSKDSEHKTRVLIKLRID
ncbi:hypothetical protein JTE90_024554 [Oedothorax gibbosus]|uniref:Sodium/potassium-transporting ATPase subunit beta n=1 Tax=Oedothorax gibbosus TaxID=931172 RepID=A0AAV6VDY3_9ARAC|nr:hypothetical protein JTE90_024554 [Oedothorax gibbosus]